ncbi:hypothetical protein SDC9_135972 [bioreactor metagenome]|uniref:Uncharacterized protein n=1 Tax=bioreactor metagenome TaxID=1076179 RepID=A0A645DIM4_9ZZZZ
MLRVGYANGRSSWISRETDEESAAIGVGKGADIREDGVKFATSDAGGFMEILNDVHAFIAGRLNKVKRRLFLVTMRAGTREVV